MRPIVKEPAAGPPPPGLAPGAPLAKIVGAKNRDVEPPPKNWENSARTGPTVPEPPEKKVPKRVAPAAAPPELPINGNPLAANATGR